MQFFLHNNTIGLRINHLFPTLTYRIQRYLITPHYSQINFLLRFSYSPLNLQLCIFPRVFSTRHFPRLSVQRGRQRQRNIEYPEDGQHLSLSHRVRESKEPSVPLFSKCMRIIVSPPRIPLLQWLV